MAAPPLIMQRAVCSSLIPGCCSPLQQHFSHFTFVPKTNCCCHVEFNLLYLCWWKCAIPIVFPLLAARRPAAPCSSCRSRACACAPRRRWRSCARWRRSAAAWPSTTRRSWAAEAGEGPPAERSITPCQTAASSRWTRSASGTNFSPLRFMKDLLTSSIMEI